MKFSVSHADDSPFVGAGLRAFFEYRDLGIAESTDGKVVAHVIRAAPEMHASGERHYHELEFQLVYCLNGWVKFEHDGIGEVTLRKGSCVHQPPGIRHRELAHSDDVELLEIVLPADFKTINDE